MIRQLLASLQPAPFITPIQDPQKIDQSYGYWRIRIVYSLFLGYAIFYLTRKTFTYAMPYIAQEFSYSKFQLGLIGSALYLSYGISKFISGAMSDRSNPRYFMAIGLILTGVCNILFSLSHSFILMVLFWGLNGWFQAWGWPACCKSLTYWFRQSERGFWYSVCNTSHNVGGALIPVMSVFLALQFGWRFAFFIPAAISILMGIILINRLRDMPQSLGLPPIEQKNSPTQPHLDQPHFDQPQSLSLKEIMFNNVLNNKFVWIFALCNFFVYFVRTAICDWSVLYLIEVKSLSDTLASSGPFWFEALGILGMLAAGWISDFFFKGNRVPIIILCGIGMLFTVVGLCCVPEHIKFLSIVCMGFLGFFVYGPQMIVGLASSECVDKRAASAANGFAGTLGYLGAVCAGFPVGLSIDLWGWQGFYWAMMICSTLVFILLLPFRSNKQTYQRKIYTKAYS